MSAGTTKGSRPALVIAFVAVAAVQVLLLRAWGEPPLLYDEAGYELATEAVAGWAGDGFGAPLPPEVGRVALHNPGYAVALGVVRWTTGATAAPMRVLQALIGLLSGLVLFHALRRRVPDGWALTGALALWLHPSALFFRLTLWPTAAATGLVALAVLCALRLADDVEDRGRQWALGLVFAPLPFVAAPALALLPALLVWPGPRRGWRVAAPFLALGIPWAAAVSITVGSFSPMDTSAACNLALGNHDLVAADRGSLWGDPEGRAAFEALRGDACPQTDALARIRCEARWCGDVARTTVTSDPGAAGVRAARRGFETWRTDTFAPRHLDALGFPRSLALRSLLMGVHLALLGLALLGLRTREGRAAWAAVGLWTVPALLSVGFTRVRQPLLPVLVFAAVIGIAHLVRERGRTAQGDGGG